MKEREPDMILDIKVPGEEKQRIEITEGGETQALVLIGKKTSKRELQFQTSGCGEPEVLAALLMHYLGTHKDVFKIFHQRFTQQLQFDMTKDGPDN